MKPYVYERVPPKYNECGKEMWYFHMRDFPNIPVFGSIGSKEKAKEVCKTMNTNAGR